MALPATIQNVDDGGHTTYVSSTPGSFPKSITPVDRAASYAKMNKTILGTNSVGYDGSTTKGSESVGHNMKHAMKRKVHLPSAMPRRQDVIYDLNGRPLYRGGYLRAVEGTMYSKSNIQSFKNSNQEYPGADISGEQATDSKSNFHNSA